MGEKRRGHVCEGCIVYPYDATITHNTYKRARELLCTDSVVFSRAVTLRVPNSNKPTLSLTPSPLPKTQQRTQYHDILPAPPHSTRLLPRSTAQLNAKHPNKAPVPPSTTNTSPALTTKPPSRQSSTNDSRVKACTTGSQHRERRGTEHEAKAALVNETLASDGRACETVDDTACAYGDR